MEATNSLKHLSMSAKLHGFMFQTATQTT